MAKLIFTGSDVLFCTRFVSKRKFPTKKSKLVYMFGMFLFVKICDLFVERFYAVSEHLIDELKPLGLKKPISVLIDPPQEIKNFKNKAHDGFTVLYYRGIGSNQIFKNWIYCYDEMKKVSQTLNANWYRGYDEPSLSNGINIIEVNGNNDMNKIYPITDVLVRMCNHDGAPRMIMECEQLGIPFYWSKENPNKEDIIKFINDALQKT